MSPDSIGFIGLGNMGSHIARHLQAHGYPVVGYDRAGTAGRIPEGAQAARSVEEVANSSAIVLLSLPNADACITVCTTIAQAPERRTRIIVDLSTIGIQAARSCSALLRKSGIEYIDAPVSGGVPGAREGTLTVMVATSEELLHQVTPLLKTFTKAIFHVGTDPGLGQAMKLVNNLISATSLAITCEAVALAERCGIPLQVALDVLNASSGRTTASSDKFPKSILPRTYDYGFANSLQLKDVQLYIQEALHLGVPLLLAPGVVGVWAAFADAHPNADTTFLYEFLRSHVVQPRDVT